jgi:YggT family protein
MVGQLLTVVLWIFLLFLIFRLIMDYVFMFARSYEPRGPMLIALEATYSITDPPLKLLRRYIPPLRFGGIALDLSFIVLFAIVYLLIALASAL